MNRFLLIAFLILSVRFIAVSQSPAVIFDSLTTKLLTSDQMLKDFNYLRQILEETHPGLYRYSSKESMQGKMDSIAGSLKAPMPFYAFYRIIAAFIADIRCAHTYAIPVKEIEKYLTGSIKTIPYEVTVLQNR